MNSLSRNPLAILSAINAINQPHIREHVRACLWFKWRGTDKTRKIIADGRDMTRPLKRYASPPEMKSALQKIGLPDADVSNIITCLETCGRNIGKRRRIYTGVELSKERRAAIYIARRLFYGKAKHERDEYE